MPRDLRATILKRTLILPTVLAVSSFGPGCGGKDDTTLTDPGGGSETGDTSTSTGTTDEPTGTTGGLPDCPMYDDDAETCSSEIDCLYLPNQSVCIVRCNNFDDQATCEMQAFCYWDTGGCYLAV